MSRSSCTVFLHSSVDYRERGYMLFVWVHRIDQGKNHTGTSRYLQDIGVRVYGPVVDRGLLEAQRSDLEHDAFVFFSKTERVPFLIRARTHLNPKITYKIVRV